MIMDYLKKAEKCLVKLMEEDLSEWDIQKCADYLLINYAITSEEDKRRLDSQNRLVRFKKARIYLKVLEGLEEDEEIITPFEVSLRSHKDVPMGGNVNSDSDGRVDLRELFERQK